MSAPDAKTDQYVVYRKGTAVPDRSTALPLFEAIPVLLKHWDTEPDYVIRNVDSDVDFGKEVENSFRAAYASDVFKRNPKNLQLRDAAGNSNEITDIEETAADLVKNPTRGIWNEPAKLWVVKPPEQNPNFASDINEFHSGLVEIREEEEKLRRPEPAAKGPAGPARAAAESKPAEPYQAEVTETEDMEIFPGISGKKALDVVSGFMVNHGAGTRFVVGALAGGVAYMVGGFKGIIGLLLFLAYLKKHINRGAKAIQDHNLDLVARAMREGLPVNKNGVIDKDVLHALWRYPVGNHDMKNRKISPAVARRPWEHNAIALDPNVRLTSSAEQVLQVVDGDTFQGKNARYRLAGIDAPEIHKKQPGAMQAKERLMELIPPGSKVRIEVVSDQADLHGRLPVYVYAKDKSGREIDVNRQLLQEGLARNANLPEPYHPKIAEYIETQFDAINAERGIYSAAYNIAAPRPLVAVNVDKNPDGGYEMAIA